MEADGPDRPIDEVLERDLRRAIIERPDDDALRLVYADYWEEAGDLERAELIRLELESASHDPLSAEAITSKVRADWLSLMHGHRWRPRPSGVTAFVVGGLVSKLAASAHSFLEHGLSLFAEHPIEAVMFAASADDEPGLFSRIAALPALSRLRDLMFGGDDDEGFSRLLESPYLGTLRSLSLMSHDLRGAAAITQSSRRLEELGLTATGEARDPELLARLGSADLGPLRSLDLSGIPAGSEMTEVLFGSPSLAGLESLALARNPGIEDGLSALASSPAGQSLQKLGLGYQVGDAITDVVSTLPALESLAGINDAFSLARRGLSSRLVELEHEIFVPATVRMLAALDTARLRSLTLHLGYLDDSDLEPLAGSEMPQLVSAAMFGMGETRLGSALARWSALPALRTLALCGVGLEDDGIAAIASVGLSALVLDLSGNPFGDRGLDALVASGTLAHAVSLDLSETHVSDAGLARFAARDSFPDLLALKVRDARVSDELAARLAERYVIG